jgi:large subunit ribosomal protein L6
MSRIGKKAVQIPSGVTVTVSGNVVRAKGAKGELTLPLPARVRAAVAEGAVTVQRDGDSKPAREQHGTVRSKIHNMLLGVTQGYQKVLEIEGVGYRAHVQGATLSIALGGIKPAVYTIPAGLQISVENNTKITIRGCDKELVGEAASEIRKFYPPEPYKGKGIRYEGEHIRRKAGKTAAA